MSKNKKLNNKVGIYLNHQNNNSQDNIIISQNLNTLYNEKNTQKIKEKIRANNFYMY